MMRTSYDHGRYTEGEDDVLIGTVKMELGTETRGIIFAHGSGGSAAFTYNDIRWFFRVACIRATIHLGDLGGQTWGSDLVIKRMNEALELLKDHGVKTPVGLIGQSMGGCSVLNYAYRYPNNVACVAANIPLLDMANIRANPLLAERYAEIDAIYGAPPNADYTDHSPVLFASKMSKKVPVRIWYSSNDPLIAISTVEDFASKHPNVETTNVGPMGHTNSPLINNIKATTDWMSKYF